MGNVFAGKPDQSSSQPTMQPSREPFSQPSGQPSERKNNPVASIKRRVIESIDLTLNDDEDEEDDYEQMHEQVDNEVQLFKINTTIVGKRYYSGSVNQGEEVILVREPQNPYDRNAIKVLTIDGQQAGHIEAKNGTAGILSPLMDGRLLNLEKQKIVITIEAVVFTSGLATSQAQLTIVSQISDKLFIFQYLNSRNIPFYDITTGMSYKGFQFIREKKLIQQANSPGNASSRSSSGGNKPNRNAVDYNVKIMSNDDIIREFDRIFDAEQQELSSIQFQPKLYSNFSNIFTSTLYRHQEQAVAWMINKETSQVLAPLYEQKSDKTFFNLLTKHDEKTMSYAPLGGLLLDDMGLGKSACVLALMLCNGHGSVSFPDDDDEDEDEDEVDFNERVVDENRYPTLIVCPLSVISSWETQFKTHIKENKLRVLVYHGTNRLKSDKEIQSYDVVITNYDSVSADCKALKGAVKKRKTKGTGNLFDINWHRVVVDEAHVIRNAKTFMAKAVLQLTSKYRWILTGTPMPNGVADLESLFLFLGLSLFVSPTVASASESNGCFHRCIVRELKSGNGEALVHLKQLMRSLALKRTKTVIDAYIPGKTEQIVTVTLNKSEKDAYDAIQNVITSYVARQSLDNQDYTTVLGFLTRLRQACLDIRLVPSESLVKLLATARDRITAESATITLSETDQKDLLNHLESIFSVARDGAKVANEENEGFENVECCICLEAFSEVNSVIFRKCKHTICKSCDTALFKVASVVPCPLCRTEIVANRDRINYDLLMRELESANGSAVVEPPDGGASTANQQSSKTKAVIDMLKHTGSDKIAIFSQFVAYLSILQQALVAEGYQVVLITGQLTQKQRTNALVKFSTDPRVKVILCSTKACGVGINLVAANHIYLTDMWWSPAVDHQAIDRVHRLGQTKTVNVVRFVVANSIDEKIIEIQKKKILQTKTLLESGRERSKEERKADMMYLLGV